MVSNRTAADVQKIRCTQSAFVQISCCTFTLVRKGHISRECKSLVSFTLALGWQLYNQPKIISKQSQAQQGSVGFHCGLYGGVFRFRFPDCRHRAFRFSAAAKFVVFGDMLGSSTRRGRAPANNSDVLAMFSLVYSGEGASQPLVDDSS